jgi:hypothetical protein
MPLPSLEELIHSLHQNQEMINRIDDFSNVLGDIWNQSWVKEERIFRVNDPDRISLPIYSADDVQSSPDISNGTPDTLAFYISYHYSRYQWGIYLLRSGVLRLAKHLVKKGLSNSASIDVAREFLIRHELTHFQTDFGITGLELMVKEPIYLKFREEIRSITPGWNSVEEGLANRLARSEVGSNGKKLNDFLNGSPQGYCDWNSHKPKDESMCWSNILSLNSILRKSSDSRILGLSSMIVAKRYFSEVPIYEVIDMSEIKPADYFLGPISQIRETVEFLDDIKKLAKGQPHYRKKWEKTKEKLKNGNLIGGTHLEKLKGTRIPIYSVGLDAEARVALRKESTWEAIAADHHDPLYARMTRKFGS